MAYNIIHRGPKFQAGRGAYTSRQGGAGVGAIFSALGRFLIPLFRRGGSAALKSGITFAKSKAGKRAIKKATKGLTKTGMNLATNIVKGKNAKKDLSNDLQNAASQVVSAVNQKKKPGKKKKRQPLKARSSW